MKPSEEIEKYCIAGLLKFPDVLAELGNTVTEASFNRAFNKAVYRIVKNRYNSQQPVNGIIISETLEKQGINSEGGIDRKDYLESLEYIQIKKKGVLDYFRELKQIHLRSEIYKIGSELRKVAERNPDLTEVQLLTLANSVFNQKLSLQNVDLQPEDLFSNVVEIIEKLALNPMEEAGIPSPYATYNRIFGGFLNKEVYAFVARPGEGKSTILNDVCHKVCLGDNNARALILDTEMQTSRMKMRKAAAVTGIPLWWLKTGNFMKNEIFKKIWYEKKDEFKKLEGRISHIHVPGVEISRIVSMVRRWRHGHIGLENTPIVAYDYVKLTGENDHNKKEWQLIGEKLDSIKMLSDEIDCPILTACQLNRQAAGKNAVDDSSAIAQSDRLMWYAAFVAIFRRKYPEQIGEGKFGTHCLIPLKEREQGRDAKGHNLTVKIKGLDGEKNRYVVNHINFNVENFNVEDMGTLEDEIEQTVATGKLPEASGESIDF